MSEHDDENTVFIKIDPNDPETLKLIKQTFDAEGEDGFDAFSRLFSAAMMMAAMNGIPAQTVSAMSVVAVATSEACLKNHPEIQAGETDTRSEETVH